MNSSSSFCGSLLAGMRARGLATPAPVPLGLALTEDAPRTDGVASRTMDATPLPLFPVNLSLAGELWPRRCGRSAVGPLPSRSQLNTSRFSLLADYLWDSQRRTPAAPQKPEKLGVQAGGLGAPGSATVLKNMYAKELQSAEGGFPCVFTSISGRVCFSSGLTPSTLVASQPPRTLPLAARPSPPPRALAPLSRPP